MAAPSSPCISRGRVGRAPNEPLQSMHQAACTTPLGTRLHAPTPTPTPAHMHTREHLLGTRLRSHTFIRPHRITPAREYETLSPPLVSKLDSTHPLPVPCSAQLVTRVVTVIDFVAAL